MALGSALVLMTMIGAAPAAAADWGATSGGGSGGSGGPAGSPSHRLWVEAEPLDATLPTIASRALPADAARSCHPGYACTYYEVISVTKTDSYVDLAKPIASCTVGTSGATCAIGKGKSVARTVGVQLGVSSLFVSASLHISTETSESTTVTCTSPALRAGQSWLAYGQGVKFTYKVKKWMVINGMPSIPQTSSETHAFDPEGDSIYCVAAA